MVLLSLVWHDDHRNLEQGMEQDVGEWFAGHNVTGYSFEEAGEKHKV